MYQNLTTCSQFKSIKKFTDSYKGILANLTFL